MDKKNKLVWFVDYTEAYNRIHQPLLVDELKRRYQALVEAIPLADLWKKTRKKAGSEDGYLEAKELFKEFWEKMLEAGVSVKEFNFWETRFESILYKEEDYIGPSSEEPSDIN